MRGISWLPEDLLASQEEICSPGLVTRSVDESKVVLVHKGGVEMQLQPFLTSKLDGSNCQFHVTLSEHEA